MEEDPFGMKEFRENILKMYPDYDLEQLKVDEERIISDMRALREMGQHHVLGGPLLDLLSVTVRPKISPPPKGSWRIARKIYFRKPDSQRGPTDPNYLYMFQRKSNNSQYRDPNAPFLTIDLASPVFGIFPAVELCLELLAKQPRSSQTRPLLTNTLRLDYTNYPDYKFDTVQHHDVTTSDADLCVKYITYRAAISTKVNFSLNVPNGQQSRQVKVSGRIYASWHHNKEHFKPHLIHERHCTCVCFFNSCFSLVTTGQPFPLSRSFASVPSYATLILEVILSIEGVKCHHVLDFPARNIDTTHMEFEVAGGLIGKICLQWCYEVLLDNKEEEEKEETITQSGGKKKVKLTMPQLPKSICIHDTMLDKELVGALMIEIYSIYVGANNKSTECRVNDTIDVRDGWRKHRIFEMNEGNLTRKFVHGTTLPLVGPHRCLVGNCFVKVRVRDDKGREFCKGYLGWDLSTRKPPWLDKWLCSIIKGQLGFTEIHYAL